MSFVFSKYHGSGNDFILVDDRNLFFPIEDREWIAFFCHRQFGIGADGIILLQPSLSCDVKMRIFNSDGCEAQSCGNGMLCLLRFLARLGFAEREYTIELMKGKAVGKIEKGRTSIELQMPGSAAQIDLRIEDISYPIFLTDTGVPHAVYFCKDLENVSVEALGKKLRFHPLLGEKGANINFVEKREKLFFVRTYERGVENETLACGTGACAVAFVAKTLYNVSDPLSIRYRGGAMEIFFPGQERLVLEGESTFVYSGTIEKKEIYHAYRHSQRSKK